MKKLIIIAAAFVTFAGFALAPIVFLGCSSPPVEPPITVKERQVAAESAFTAALLKCVADFPSGDPRVDVCADGVRADWHRKDGGA